MDNLLAVNEHRLRTFKITFSAYACVHVTRTTWANSKPFFQAATGCEDWYLGICDFLFMFCYAIGLMCFGKLGDQMNLKNFLLIGLIGITGFQFIIGVVGLALEDHPNAILPLVAILMSFRGFFEFSCWPGCVTSMGNWFGSNKRGFVMSLWVGCKNFGDTSGFLIMGSFVLRDLGWKWPICFLLVSFMQALCATWVYLQLEPYPEKLGFRFNQNQPEDQPPQIQSPPNNKSVNIQLQGISFAGNSSKENRFESGNPENFKAPENHDDDNKSSIGAEPLQEQENLEIPIKKETIESPSDREYIEVNQSRRIQVVLENKTHPDIEDNSPQKEQSEPPKLQNVLNAQSESYSAYNKEEFKEREESIGFLEALRIDGVKKYLLVFLCLKCTQYGILFWLPLYLHNKDENVQQEEGEQQEKGRLEIHAPYIATMFPIGSWFGGTVQGLISDKIGKRAIVMCPMLLGCAGLMFIVDFKLGVDPSPYYLVIFLIGICLGGPYNNVASVCTTDLAQKYQMSGKKSSLSTISSLLESIAVIGASLFQIVLSYNYSIAFYLFTINCLITFMILYPIAQKEIKELEIEDQLQEINTNQIQLNPSKEEKN